MATRIAAVSGGQRDVFDEMFWAGVTETSPEGHPLRGSIGVAYHPFKDLKTLEDIEDVEKEYVNKADPSRPDLGAPLGRRHAVAVKQYFRFCEDRAHTHFFIKKGGVALWLVRKTSGYVFDARDVPHWACHRIHFEFVRVATKEEGERRTGVNARSLYWMDCSTPVELLDSPLSNEKTVEPKVEPIGEPMLTQGKVVRKKKLAPAPGTKTLEEVMEGLGTGAGAGAAAPCSASKKPVRKPSPPLAPPAITIGTSQTVLSDYTRPTITLTPAFLEVKEAPLSVEQVEVIKVKLFEHDGVQYYREPTKNKLYKRLGNGSIGPYHGRWIPKMKTIDTTIPDADEDD